MTKQVIRINTKDHLDNGAAIGLAMSLLPANTIMGVTFAVEPDYAPIAEGYLKALGMNVEVVDMFGMFSAIAITKQKVGSPKPAPVTHEEATVVNGIFADAMQFLSENRQAAIALAVNVDSVWPDAAGRELVLASMQAAAIHMKLNYELRDDVVLIDNYTK